MKNTFALCEVNFLESYLAMSDEVVGEDIPSKLGICEVEKPWVRTLKPNAFS